MQGPLEPDDIVNYDSLSARARLLSRLSPSRLQGLGRAKWLLLIIGLYVVIMSCVVLLRFYTFRTHAFDLGIFNQAFSTALQGKLFYETPDLYAVPSGIFLGVHFNLLMFMLLPLYALFPYPQTLLILQTGIVALGSVPVYLIARRILETERIAVVMALIFLVNPSILNLNLYDFHLEAFLPFFLGMFFYCYLITNWRGYTLFLALSLITIDFAALVIVAICLAHALRTYHFPATLDIDRRRGLILLLTAVASLITFFLVVNISVALSGRSVSTLGAISAFVNPALGSHAIIQKTEFWLLCLIPLMFLPLLVPSQLVMVAPWFLVTALEGLYATSYNIGYQVAGAFVVPYLILASILALDKLQRHHLKLQGFIVGIFLLSLLISPFNPLTQNRLPGIIYEQGFPLPTPHDNVLAAAIGLIPANASVLTQNNLFPQVSSRADSYIYPPQDNTPIEYILADAMSSTYVQGPSLNQTMKVLLPHYMSTGNYGIVVNDDGVLLLKANYGGTEQLAGATNYTYNYRTLDLRTGLEQFDPTSASGTVLVHNSSKEASTTFWFGPYVSLPPGEYTVTFVLKTSGASNGSLLLQVDNFENATSVPVLAQIEVTQASFPRPGAWTPISITFDYTPQQSASGSLEFRGVNVVGGPFSLDYVRVQYLTPAAP